MKVQQLLLRNVRGIKDLELDFRDPVTDKPMSRIVLAGGNGSGKTTILECIFGLIRSLTQLKEPQIPYLERSGSARLVLQPGQIFKTEWAILFNKQPTQQDRKQQSYLAWLDDTGEGYGFDREASGDIYELVAGPEEYEEFSQNNSLVYLTDDRRLLPATGGPIAPEEENPWAYRYKPTDQWKGSVESYLVWQNYLDLEDRDKGIQADRFQRIASVINQLLDQKRIAGVERGRVVIEVSSQKKHGLDDLSSGEREIVLLLGVIARHIKPGSIILIDEPELSLHPTWQRGLVVALDKIIEQYDAQVILATHSPEIAGMVHPHEVRFLSDLGLPPGEWKPEREALA